MIGFNKRYVRIERHFHPFADAAASSALLRSVSSISKSAEFVTLVCIECAAEHFLAESEASVCDGAPDQLDLQQP